MRKSSDVMPSQQQPAVSSESRGPKGSGDFGESKASRFSAAQRDAILAGVPPVGMFQPFVSPAPEVCGGFGSDRGAAAGPVMDGSPTSDPCDDAQQRRSRAEQARINGARSRGPVTSAGKAVSSQNALKHGLCARGVLIPGEDPAIYQAFVDDFIEELNAVGSLQVTLAERAAELAWKLKRVPVLETSIFAGRREGRKLDDLALGGLGDLIQEMLSDDDTMLVRLQRYELRLERSMRGCLRELREVQRHAVLYGARERGNPRTDEVAGDGVIDDFAIDGAAVDGGTMDGVTSGEVAIDGALTPVSEVVRRPGCPAPIAPGIRVFGVPQTHACIGMGASLLGAAPGSFVALGSFSALGSFGNFTSGGFLGSFGE
ncbi:hypothetical protein [Humisphaera borealis]|uniref:Uncharacterized protein n=1 Tax=Humisphaera borealis TaxID=2807512 RepID=A0A7M2WVB2_9BACT|nr:hypothetical protein [Humisphaera borealis]QOV89425.1 hypothetical protein IPV69_25040 [Humisphaera borealis]